MANNLNSNFSTKLMRAFLPAFERERVVSKTVNTQLFSGRFNPASGTTVDIKRPHQYRSRRTTDGDISSGTNADIQSGKATATVQNYITIKTGWDNVDEALKLDQLTEILQPAAEEMVTTLETSLQDYMIQNAALSVGDPDTNIDAWTDIAKAGSLLRAIGVPGPWYYVMSPYVAQNLLNTQTGLSAGDPLVKTAWEMAQLPTKLAGLRALTSNSMSSWTRGAGSDDAGTLSATPTATYVGAKDTMQQTWSVTGFGNGQVIAAGDVLEVTGRYHVNVKTRQIIYDENGTAVPFRVVNTAAVTLDGSGAGDLTVQNAGIFEFSSGSSGPYDNISSALASGDVITVLGTTATNYQPALFYNRNAFVLATVKLPKLYSTDTIATTQEGFSIRVSKYSDGDANTQSIRFDMLPAFGCMNPMFAGKGFGS